MINFKNRDLSLVQRAIADAGEILTSDGNGNLIISDATAIQAIIDALPEPMPDLLPSKFKYLLAKNNFVPVIDILLENVKSESVEKYARYYGFLKSATRYEYDLAYTMFDEIRDKFTAIDERFNFSDEQLRAMWMEASQV